jgi:polysaccharide biosynthesis PFTS motif protein
MDVEDNLKTLLITNFLARKNRNRLKRMMRGYRYLKKNKSLNLIPDLKRDFTTQPLSIKKSHFSKFIFGEGIGQAEVICRQYLMVRVAGLNLNRVLLSASGRKSKPIVHYLPPEWLQIARDRGISVAPIRTMLLWQLFASMMLAYGVLRIAKIIFSSAMSILKQTNRQHGCYVYFNDLSSGHLPQPCKDGRSHDIITWYSKWSERNQEIEKICHGVSSAEQSVVNGMPVVSIPAPIPPLLRFGSFFRFIAWGVGASLLATFDLMRGRWWHALMLNQAALSAQVRRLDSRELAKDYMFHNSGWIYRPLWTYEAERQGARIFFYFYSTNCEGFKRGEGYPPLNYGWQAMSWPNYLVWDEYQADFVRRAVGEESNIEVVGQIGFQTSVEEMPEFNGKAIAVFDVIPHRASSFQMLGFSFVYVTPNTCASFLGDIQQVAENAGYKMLWKRKRNLGSVAHPQYRHFSKQLSLSKNMIIVDSDISANRVIEASMAVISMPFTSTSLIARDLGKPTCYYDPSDLIQPDDRAAHGIEIIKGPGALTSWLKRI